MKSDENSSKKWRSRSNKNRKRYALFSAVIFVILFILVFPFNVLAEPTLSTDAGNSITSMSANFRIVNSTVPMQANNTISIGKVTANGNLVSTLSLRVYKILAYWNSGDKDINVVANIQIIGNFSSSIRIASFTLNAGTVVSNKTSTSYNNGFLTAFLYQKTRNATVPNVYTTLNYNELSYNFKLVDRPHWFIFGGYNVSRYIFSYSGQNNLWLVPYTGLHIIKYTVQVNLYGKLLTSTVEINLLNE